MLIDLLQSGGGTNSSSSHQQHSPFSPSSDRLITGNYKTNGNLVSLKIDILDSTEFQRNGCLSSPGTNGLSTSHSHNVTGTLFCQPDTNTVRLNITVLGGGCQDDKSWSGCGGGPPKDVKPWVLHTSNKMTSGSINDSGPMLVKSGGHGGMNGCSINGLISGGLMGNGDMCSNTNDGSLSSSFDDSHCQPSSFSHPPPAVSPPTHDAPPPLMDFQTDQLMSEIHSLSFDYAGGVTINSQLLSADTCVPTTCSPTTANNGIISRQFSQQNNCSSLNNSQDLNNIHVQQQQPGQQHGQQLGQHHQQQGEERNRMLSGGIKQETPSFQLQVAQALASLSPLPSNNTMSVNQQHQPHIQQQQQHHQSTTTKIHLGGGGGHMSGMPTLLQPKTERSDSICSEYSTTTVKDDLLGYADDLDAESSSLSNPSPSCTLASSPLLFPPSGGGGGSICSPTTLASSPLLFPPSTCNALSPTSTIIFSSNSIAQDKNTYFSKSFSSHPLESHNNSNNLNQAPKWQLTPAICTTTSNNHLISTQQHQQQQLSSSPGKPHLLLSSSSPLLTLSTPPMTTTSSSNAPTQLALFQSLSSLTEPPQLTIGGGNGGNIHAQPAPISKSRHQSSTVTSSCNPNQSPTSRPSEPPAFLLTPSTIITTRSPATTVSLITPTSTTNAAATAGGIAATTNAALSPHTTTVSPPKPRNRRNSSFDESKPHICGQCGARFTTKSNLGQHAKIHLAVKPFICEICSHGFTRAAHYESHVAKHKGLKTHRCDQCGESFARLDNLLRHSARNQYTNKDDNIHKSEALKRHKHGKIFDCGTCGKGFHRKDKLVEHEKVHSEYKFQCTRCTKAFHTNDALKHHLPNHEDPTKTQCHICLKFITSKSLSKHMASSHKETTAVNNSENNNNNMNKVGGGGGGNSKKNKGNEEKNIPCQYCKKSFVSPAKLRLHVAKCHAVEKSNAIEAARAAAAQQQQQAEEQQLAAATARVFLDEYQLNATLSAVPSNTGGHIATKDQLLSIVSHTQLSKDQLISAQMNKDKVYTSGGDNGGNNAGIVQSLLNSGSHHQQVVPELELNYVNSSPEDINMETIHKVGGGQGSGGMDHHHVNSSLNIPTIHIPEFEPKLGPNEISTEALQALLFN